METKKLELQVRINDLREQLDRKILDLRPTSWLMSDELYDILDEVVDDLDNNNNIVTQLDDAEEKLEECENMDDLDEVDCDLDVIEYNIDNYFEIGRNDVYDKIYDHFIYDDDAYEYLKSQNISDFEDAIADGITKVCDIASYYLAQEYEEL